MKKSEMVEILVNKLHTLDGEKIDNDFYYKLCNMLIDECEKNGMLPPRTYLSGLGLFDNGWETE